MKNWTLALVFVLSVNSLGQADVDMLDGPGLSDTPSEAPQLTSSQEFEDLLLEASIDSHISQFAEVINRIQLGMDTGYTIAQTEVHDKCTVFMNKEHFLGTAGTSIYKLLSEKPHLFPHVMAGGYAGEIAKSNVKPVVSLAKYCRKYPSMTVKQRALVWVLLMTVVAHFESSCNIKAAAKGPNGTAFGFYQLHKGKEEFYDGKKGLCSKNASANASLSSQCALSMIDMQLGRSKGQLFFNKSYWDVLRPNGSSKKAREIAKALSQFQLCNPVSM